MSLIKNSNDGIIFIGSGLPILYTVQRMITKLGWVDRNIPESIKNLFMEFGEKIECFEGEIILNENQRSDSFYYVSKGLLAVALYENFSAKGIIVKFVPKGRVFGFAEFLCGKRRRYRLDTLRDSSIYKIKYTTMEYLMQKTLASKRLLKLYGKRALDTKHATHALMSRVSESDKAFVIAANLAAIKDWDEYGRYKKVIELSPKELLNLKHIDRNRNSFRRGKEKIISFPI